MRPTRYGTSVEVSGKALDQPIGGMGKLLPGTHRVEVISLSRTAANRWSVILQARNRECHADILDHWPPTWVLGRELVADVGLGQGFVLFTSERGFQGRDPHTKARLTDWMTSARDVYVALRPLDPAVPVLRSLHDPVTNERLDLSETDQGVHPAANSGAVT